MMRPPLPVIVLVAALLAWPAPARSQESAAPGEAAAPVVDLPNDSAPAPLADTLLPNSASIAPPAIETLEDADSKSAPSGATEEGTEKEDGAADNAVELAALEPDEKKTLDERLVAIATSGLDDDDKKKATQYYQRALNSFDIATQQVAAADGFDKQLALVQKGKDKNGRSSAAWYRARLAAPLPPYADTTGVPLAEVEKWAETCETSLAYYRAEFAAMIAEPKRRSQRLAELPKQIAEAHQGLKDASEALAAQGGEEAADIVAAARRQALKFETIEHQATLMALKSEQRFYQESADWVTTRRDYYARYVPHKEKRLEQLHEIINRAREQAAQEQARLASAAAEAVESTRPKEILALANANKELADEQVKISESLSAATQDYVRTQTMLLALTEQFDRAKLRAQEISSADGQLLRDQQSKLPDVRELQRRHAAREPLLSELQLRAFDLYDQSSELANLDEEADDLAARVGDLSAETRVEVRRLLEAKRDTLKALVKAYEDYSSKLGFVHTEEAKLIAKATDYGAFIAERVLWIRSCAPPLRRDLKHAMHAMAWSLDPHNWRDAGQTIVGTGRRKPAQFAIGVLSLAALLLSQRAARRQLRELGAESRKRGCTRLRPTFHALWLTGLVALPWPALLAIAGWTMDNLNESEFVRSLGGALRFTAICLLLLELARHLCRQNGLADAHFGWPTSCLTYVRHKFRWITMLGLPATVWLVGLELQAEEPTWSSSLGRALFIGVMLLLSVVWHRVLLAKNSPFRQISVISQGGWLTPLQVVWRPAIVLLPSALALLALVGYYYTAQQAAVRILQSAGMLLAVLTLGGLTRRWLLVSRRRLAREQAKQRRGQLASVADDASALPSFDTIDEALDLAALSDQTQKLVRTFLATTTVVGLVLIWSAILPALSYLGNAPLISGAVPTDTYKPLTWSDLTTCLLVLAVTFVSVRDVPALLELVVLQHLPLDSGSRYAFTTMSRYALTAAGLTAAFHAIGGEWENIQWLVAAMSVGLGFGLQDIFANFVSGIILLFERPIRVGDVVTIGDKTGVVNRIRMRSTTIVDPDRKEYIVPNKDLVTERLLNWTLTDFTNRIEIVVNVASGTDTDVACQLLLQAAREQPHILPDPQPSASFEGFAEGGLKLALRCFLPNLDNRASTIHNLHTTVDRKFRAASIEGAYGDMRIRVTRDSHHAQAQQTHFPFAEKTGDARQGAA